MRILGILLVLLLSSCALTYDVTPHKCELMQRGQPCLSDHTCCKPSTTYYNSYPNYYNWWWATRPTYTNYVIVKPNNKPTYHGHRPSWNSNKPKPNKNRSKRK